MINKFGIVIGRFQPVHMGHQNIVNEIILDGRIPIIVIGSCNDDRDLDKNPLSFNQRVELWKLLYPNIKIHFIKSNDVSNEDWYFHIKHETQKIVKSMNNVVVYYHNKEVDRTTYNYNNKTFTDTFFTDIFEGEGWFTYEIQFANRADIKIDANARDIRHDLEAFKHLLDGRIYHKLKYWGDR